jgi:RHS repeat-associated protein
MRFAIRAACLWGLVAGLGITTQALGQDLAPPPPPQEPLNQAPETDLERLSAGKQPWEEYAKFISNQTAVTSLGPDLFGDQVNLQNGALSFSATDVSLPGNSSLPVAIRRSFSVGSFPVGTLVDLPFSDWELDVPRITAVRGNDWPDNRCDYTGPQGTIFSGSTPYTADDYWQGMHAEMPGGGEILVADNASVPKPDAQPGIVHRWLTPAFTYFSCLPSVENGTGQGFLAITADGTKYWFNRMAQYSQPPLLSPSSSLGLGSISPLSRKKHVLYATRVEDRFGHFVTYTYTNTATSPARLTQVQASDGRLITLAYNAQNKVQSVSAHGRTWTYGYTGGSLTSVTLPDASAWTIDLGALASAEVEMSAGDQGSGTPCGSLRPMIPGQATGTVTHPSGAIGTFVVSSERHGRSNVPRNCLNIEVPINDRNNDVVKYVRHYETMSLSSKTVTGVGLDIDLDNDADAITWDYTYQPGYSWSCTDLATCPANAPPDPVCLSDDCAGASTTVVSGPNNDWRRYTFGNSYRYNEGKLLEVARGPNSSGILETESLVYRLPGSRLYSQPIGTSYRGRGDGFVSEHLRPQLQRTIARNGDTFRWTGGIFDAFQRPTVVTRSSSLGFSRSETIGYFDDTFLWVVGQVGSVLDNETLTYPEQTIYDNVTALPILRYSFGRRLSQSTYHDTGTQKGLLKEIFDSSNVKKTTLSNYHRGLPRSVVFHDGNDQQVVVNNHGEITQFTDEMNYSTGYGRDSMGRINSITYPGGDSTVWTGQTITFQKHASAAYGLPGGHWRQSITHGNYRKTIFLDALWRPVLTQEYDDADLVDTRRMIARRFDHEGREIFASYAEGVVTAWNAPTLGVRNFFDALGRPTLTEQDAEAAVGVLQTHTFYEPGFIKRVRNPRGKDTTYAFQAFDTPTDSAPVQILQPGGVLTTIVRDDFGKPASIRRSGEFLAGPTAVKLSATRNYIYDGHERLCKRVDPESAATHFAYDASENIAWTLPGSASTDLSCDDFSQGLPADRIARTYDARNRLLSIDYPGTTIDVGFSYTADGLLETATTGQWNPSDPSSHYDWDYTYNKRRLPTFEHAQIGGGKGKTYTYEYTSLGHLKTVNYPYDVSVDYAPNALGQPTQAGIYASDVQYFPSGTLKQFIYGNGVTRINTQNARKLIERTRDTAGTVFHDFGYSFDKNANVAGITDHATGLQTRTMQYDDLDRLTHATSAGQWGAATYGYDPLDNLRTANIGPQQFVYHYNTTTNRLDSISGTQAWSFGYDVRGNQTSKTGSTYVFDAANRLRSTAGIQYAYDAHGRRVGEIRPTGGKYAMYTQDGVMRGEFDGSVHTAHIYLGKQLIATQKSNSAGPVSKTFHHADALGSPVAETSDASPPALVQSTYYAPYGAALNRTVDGPGYTGHIMDAPTGLVYMQQRYYDPVVGRFLSVDPMEVDTGTGWNFSRYNYGANNPYKYTDSDGRAIDTFFDAADVLYNAGQVFGGGAAFAVGVATGNQALMDEAGAGLSAARGDMAIAGAALVVPGANSTMIKGATLIGENAAKGAKAENEVAAALGDAVAGRRVTLEASTGQRSVTDIVRTDSGVVEVKSGGARLSPGQQAVKADIDAGRPVIPRGQNAADAGLRPGEPTKMKCYDVTRC